MAAATGMGGRVALELRRGVVAPSRSMALRPGEEVDGGVPGFSGPSLIDWRRSVGGDGRRLAPVLRERLFDREAELCFGLPRDLGGMEMAADFGGMTAGLDGGLPLALLFFLSGGFDPGAPLAGAAGLPPGRGAARPSRVALISGGIGIWWTMLTDRQSAGWIMRCSEATGGRQHPGHPGLR